MIRRGSPLQSSRTIHPKMTVVPPRVDIKRSVVASNPRRIMSTTSHPTPHPIPHPTSSHSSVSLLSKEEVTPPVVVVKPDSSMYYFRVGVMSVATYVGLVMGGPLGAIGGFVVSGLILDTSK